MTVHYDQIHQRYIGASTDTKPTDAPVGIEFFETDTGATYICYDGTNWAQYYTPDVYS